MNSGVYFATGKSHHVCADYGRAGAVCRRPYAILSDGCSSSPDTDIGARLLTLAAQTTIETASPADPVLAEQPLIVAAARSRPKPLPYTCLDATLLLAYESTARVLQVAVSGDGVVVGRRREPPHDFVLYDFDCDGAPAYLSYLLDDDRREGYQQVYGKRTITVWLNGTGLLGTHHDDPFGGWADYPGQAQPFYRFSFMPEDYDLVLLLTDGVKSFQKDLRAVPMVEVVKRLLDFKSFTGEFVTRRAQTFLKRECTELGWVHTDDFGMAGIWLGDTKVEGES